MPVHPNQHLKPRDAPYYRIIGGAFILAIGVIIYWMGALSPNNCYSNVPANPSFCSSFDPAITLVELMILAGFLIVLIGAVQLALRRGKTQTVES